MALYACRKTIPIFLDDIDALHYLVQRGGPWQTRALAIFVIFDRQEQQRGIKPAILEEA